MRPAHGGPDGAVLLDISHRDPEYVKERLPNMHEQFMEQGTWGQDARWAADRTSICYGKARDGFRGDASRPSAQDVILLVVGC